ncbi:MAG: hypothetical protein PHF86_00865 [Candidatus Nanoarchaeia archaeon]|nr:hypothetical protein [Candidatus Nanoarchaeia archaeon]
MAKEFIKFLKIRKVKNPSRGYPTDAGIDFYVPEFTPRFIKDLKDKNPDIFDPGVTSHSLPYGSGLVTSSSCCGTITLQNPPVVVTYDLDDKNDTFFKFDEEKGENYFLLPPHSKVLIPSGLKSRMVSSGRALIASNKSGIASKYGVIFGAQVVDYTYQGEIHINVINTSTKVVRIYENMKLIQFIETPIFTSEIEVTESNDFLSEGGLELESKNFYKGMITDRGDGGFGSTDKK